MPMLPKCAQHSKLHGHSKRIGWEGAATSMRRKKGQGTGSTSKTLLDDTVIIWALNEAVLQAVSISHKDVAKLLQVPVLGSGEEVVGVANSPTTKELQILIMCLINLVEHRVLQN